MRAISFDFRVQCASVHSDDSTLLEALRRGDEAAFAGLVGRYHGPLLRFAMAFVPSEAIAEEVVQETWIGVLEGLSRFEGRSSLKTWIYRILTNQAKTRGVRESRSVPFSTLGSQGDDPQEPAVDPSRFLKSGPWTDHWASPPNSWDEETRKDFSCRRNAGSTRKRPSKPFPQPRSRSWCCATWRG